MARVAIIIDVVPDLHGDLWDVREKRPTPHGFEVMIGWPADRPRGAGYGAPRVILTRKLAEYLQTIRLKPSSCNLPIGKTTLKRLRTMLGYNWYVDSDHWWRENPDGPGATAGARSMRRKRMGLPSKYWTAEQDTELLILLADGQTTKMIATQMQKSESAIRSRAWKLRKKGLL